MTRAKTTEQHKKEGTYKKSRHEETAHDYSAMTDMEPPECLTAKAKEVWKRMVPDLVNIGAVEIDRTELTDAFLNYGSAQCCLEQLEGVDLGEYLGGLNKVKDVNLFDEYNKYMDKFNKIMHKYGVSPESRTRMRIKPKEQQAKDLFAELLGNG